MPWETKTVMEQREQFVSEVTAGKDTVTALCLKYGISRKTGYKWLKRAAEGLPLCDQSRRPNRQPSKTAEEIEAKIVEMRLSCRAWGGRKIRSVLEADGVEGLPSDKTCSNIIKRNGLVDPEESAKHTACQRFEKEYCNEMWQSDFKGDFLLGNGVRCYPLTVLDDHARYSLRIEPKDSATDVKSSFIAVFREYGLPNSVLSDNGSQFAGAHRGLSTFERFLMDLDILPIHGRPFHPQTQGKIERFHRTFKQEALRTIPSNMTEATVRFENWRRLYNEIRPHHALGMKPPASVYLPSTREYYEPKPYVYDEGAKLFKVNNWGYLRFGSLRLFLSESMADTRVEVRFAEDEKIWIIYRNYIIATVDAVGGKLLNRHIRRL